jgi:hypothetical protein
MNIETRKIEFIREFLKVQSEELIGKLEQVLRMEYPAEKKKDTKPMTVEELSSRIEKSEDDFKKNRFKTSDEIMKKYQ